MKSFPKFISFLGSVLSFVFFPFRRISFNSIKFKVSVLYTVFLGGILFAFCTALYFLLSIYFYQDIDIRLKVKAQETISTIRAYVDIVGDKPGSLDFAVRKTFFYEADFPISIFDTGKVKRLENKWQERADVMGLSDSYVAFISPEKDHVIVTKNFPSRLLQVFLQIKKLPERPGQVLFSNVVYKGDEIRVITASYLTFDGQRHIIHIGTSQRHVDLLLNRLAHFMTIGVPVILLMTSFVGLFLVNRILSPIEEIAKTASQITHEDLSARIKTRHLDSEVKYVVESFNDMIIRLERSFVHINDFSSHVAHELKTPLAIIKGESEVILSRERTVEEYKTAIGITLEEANRMRTTIEDLLLLAKLDYQPEIFRFESFDFTDFFFEICEQARMLASKRKLTIKVSMPEKKVFFKGDKLHLRRLFFNLIDNALKFTPSPGQITLSLVFNEKNIIATVTDSGIGIPEENLSKVFERFYHADHRSEADAIASSGLGLSIVQSIVKIHNGSIRVTSKVRQGTSFQITFPT
jgi:two-component system heavy metal sensor histidine kinase CusS